MEIALFVIAVIGLLALSGGGIVKGNVSVQPTPGQSFDPTSGMQTGYIDPNNPGWIAQHGAPIPYIAGPNPLLNVPAPTYNPVLPSPGPSTWSPTATAPFAPPQLPSTGSNVSGQLLTGGAAIGVTALSASSTGVVGGAGSAFAAIGITGAAVPIVGAAIIAAAAIAAALLAAHQKRLQDAKTENQAVDQWVPVFDSFVSSVVQAYNSGQITAQQAAQVCQQFDQTLYNKFRSFVGQPGTAWSDQTGMAGKCDKTCTVGCCVYFGDLGPVLNNISYVLGFPTSRWGGGDPRIQGRTIIVPKVFPSKYSALTRAQYSVTLN